MDSSLYRLHDGSYALRLGTTSLLETERRLPTHFILCIDTSDSMSDANKLANVKHSASLVLHFLGQQDRFSLITFGDDATIHARAVPCSAEQKGVLLDTLERIRTDGCTNLSAGLVSIREILGNRTADVAALKTGILLLTDGHANRGVCAADPLRSVVRQLHEAYPAVSLQIVGYGTDHNAELLKAFAETTAGSYSIVDNREGAATVIGESLGSLFSCVAQQVSLAPGGTLELEGNQFQIGGDPPRIQIGDIFEGNETILLFKPTSPTDTWGITVNGTLLPSLEPFQRLHLLEDAATDMDAKLELSIQLTRARYTVSRLFKTLREFRMGPSRFAEILDEVAKVEEQLSHIDSTNIIAQMLRAECLSIRNGVETLQTGTRGDVAEVAARLVAHEAYTTMGRGVVAALERTPVRRFPAQQQQQQWSDDEDPSASQYLTSPTASRTARRVTRLMATMSMGGDEATEAAHEAAEMSQGPRAP